MPTLLLRTYHGSKTLQFDTGSSFLLKIHIFYYQYAKFRNAAYEKVHLDLLQIFLKIKLKTHSKLSKKFVDKFCSDCNWTRTHNHLVHKQTLNQFGQMVECLFMS